MINFVFDQDFVSARLWKGLHRAKGLCMWSHRSQIPFVVCVSSRLRLQVCFYLICFNVYLMKTDTTAQSFCDGQNIQSRSCSSACFCNNRNVKCIYKQGWTKWFLKHTHTRITTRTYPLTTPTQDYIIAWLFKIPSLNIQRADNSNLLFNPINVFHVLAPLLAKDIWPKGLFWLDSLQFSAVVQRPVMLMPCCREPKDPGHVGTSNKIGICKWNIFVKTQHVQVFQGITVLQSHWSLVQYFHCVIV